MVDLANMLTSCSIMPMPVITWIIAVIPSILLIADCVFEIVCVVLRGSKGTIPATKHDDGSEGLLEAQSGTTHVQTDIKVPVVLVRDYSGTPSLKGAEEALFFGFSVRDNNAVHRTRQVGHLKFVRVDVPVPIPLPGDTTCTEEFLSTQKTGADTEGSSPQETGDDENHSNSINNDNDRAIKSGGIFTIQVLPSDDDIAAATAAGDRRSSSTAGLYFSGTGEGALKLTESVEGAQNYFQLFAVNGKGEILHGIPIAFGRPFRVSPLMWPQSAKGSSSYKSIKPKKDNEKECPITFHEHAVSNTNKKNWNQQSQNNPRSLFDGAGLLCMVALSEVVTKKTISIKVRVPPVPVTPLRSPQEISVESDAHTVVSIEAIVEVVHRTRQIIVPVVAITTRSFVKRDDGVFLQEVRMTLRTVDGFIRFVDAIVTGMGMGSDNNSSNSSSAEVGFKSHEYESSSSKTYKACCSKLNQLMQAAGKDKDLKEAMDKCFSMPSLLDDWYLFDDSNGDGVYLAFMAPSSSAKHAAATASAASGKSWFRKAIAALSISKSSKPVNAPQEKPPVADGDANAIAASSGTLTISVDSSKKLGTTKEEVVGDDGLFYAVASRALWKHFWREELVVIAPGKLSFFAPFAESPFFELSLDEIIKTSQILLAESPHPGCYVIKIETLLQTHYLAFGSFTARSEFAAQLLNHVTCISNNLSSSSCSNSKEERASEEQVARRVNVSISDSIRRSKSLLCGPWMPETRIVLNTRNMFPKQKSGAASGSTSTCSTGTSTLTGTSVAADAGIASSSSLTGGDQEDFCATSVRLLNLIFDEEITSLGINSSPKFFMFLEEIESLKQLDLRKLDKAASSVEAVCFFVNIYHVLLQHARVVLGRPTKETWDTYFRSVSYEIGGDDVFSLAEIEECVIKGKLSKPSKYTLSGGAPIPNTDEHYAYAVGNADFRVHLALNSSSVSCPSHIFVLTPENYDTQLNAAVTASLDHSMTIIGAKKTVMLPKAIEVYGPDFDLSSSSSSTSDVLRKCQPFLNNMLYKSLLENLLPPPLSPSSKKSSSGADPVLKFMKYICESHEEFSLALK